MAIRYRCRWETGMNLEAAEGIIGAILFMLNTLVWGFVLWLMVA